MTSALRGAVIEDDVDLVGIGDDVVVRHDQPGCVNNETPTQRINAARRRCLAVLTICPPCPRRFLKNSSKNSSKGEPGGNCGIAPLLRSTDCLVETLTTASMTCFGGVGDTLRPARRG